MGSRAAEELARATEAVKRDPNSPDAQRRLGVAAAADRRFDVAATAFEAWSRLEPNNAAPLLARARVLSLGRDRKAAQDACRAALSLDPALLGALRMMARLALAAGNLAQAQTFLQRAVQARPGSAGLHTLLAETMFRRGLLATAAESARAALELDPFSSAALSVLVRSHLVRGQLLRAQAALRQFESGCEDQRLLGALRDELALKLERRGVTPDEAAPEPQTEAFPVPASDPWPPSIQRATTPRDPPGGRSSSFEELRSATDLDFFDHLSIIRALILRNLRLKYRDNGLGFLLEFLRPTAVVVAHYYFFLVIKKHMPGDIPIAIFVIAGFPVWFAFNATAQGAMNGPNSPGRATLLPGVTTLHLQLARAIWAWWIQLVFCLGACLPLNLYGAQLPLPNVEMTLLIFVLSGAMGFGFGMLAEQMGEVWPVAKTVEKLSGWALFITSGMYFSIATTQRDLARILLFNPLLHLVEFERHAFDPGYPVGLVNLLYPAALAIGLPMVALMAKRHGRRAVYA